MSTISATTVQAVATRGLTPALVLLAMLTLIVLLIVKEIATAAANEHGEDEPRWGKAVNMAIVPFLITVAVALIARRLGRQ